MKHKSLWTFLIATVLGASLGLAVMGCLVTAYGFSVNLGTGALFCLLTAAMAAFLWVRKIPFMGGFAFLLVAVCLVLDGVAIRGAEGLLYRLTEIYSLGYGWPVVRWSDLPVQELDKALPVIVYLLGSLVSLMTARALAGRKSTVPAMGLAFVILGLCFVVTDKVPTESWVCVTFFVGAMLLLSSLVRKKDSAQGIRLTAMLAVPVLLGVLLLFAFVPKNGYNGAARAEHLTEEIASLWNRLWGRLPELSDNSAVDLADVGRQSYFDSQVLTVTAQMDGRLYLRGRVWDTYDGRSWTDSGTNLKLPWPREEELELIGEVEIATQYVHRMLYLPYYTQSLDMSLYPTGKINEYKLKAYSVTAARLPNEGVLEVYYPNAYCQLHVLGMDASAFTDLPDSTQRWARQKVEEIAGDKLSWYHIAKDIEQYVEESATYNLKTDRMPFGKNDFARWFLEEGETGYCVHFATAAAVLLRSAGIPARYVTGYMVEAKAGETVSVADSDAHAWVEYWLPPFGWVVMEATPASLVLPTTPAESRPVTEPTQTIVEKDPATAPEEPSRQMFAVFWWVLGCACLVLLAVGQRKVRIYLRALWLNRGNTNQRAINRWQYLAHCCKWLGVQPDPDCLSLAEKAKFSQYTITREELQILDGALQTAIGQLKKKNLFLQLWYRVILTLY